MKRILILAICLMICLVPLLAAAESIDLSNMSQGELLTLIDDAHRQLEKNEPEMIAGAIEKLKEKWLELYHDKYSTSRTGYLKITNTRVIYIRDKLTALTENLEKYLDPFRDMYCIVEFSLLADYYGSEPYYENPWIYYNVAVKKDGSYTVEKNSPISIYRSRTYNSDYSGIIESVKDLGGEYNAEFYLLLKK